MSRISVLRAGGWLAGASLSLAFASTAPAQSGLVGWGRLRFDSRWFDQPHLELAAGPGHTLARLADGSVVAWGDNVARQCDLPPLPPGVAVVDFDAMWQMSVLCLSNGELSCAGSWNIGCPPPAGAGRAYVAVDAGVGGHAAALLDDGAAVCWGDNTYGQCDALALPPGVAYVDVVVGGEHTAGLRSDGSLVCWGNAAHGQCAVPALPSGLTYSSVALGAYHTVALRSDGTVHCFGENSSGQCDTPALPPGVSYVEVAAGQTHTAARRSDGQLICWGANSSGQCDAPALPAGVGYVDVETGWYSTLARRSDGVTLGWGDRSSAATFPVAALPQGVSYTQVQAGVEHIVALRSNGSVACWGRADSGQCDVPDPPPGLTYVEVAAGSYHTLARLSDGAVLAWGAAVGLVPALPVGVSYVAIAAGGAHSMALRSDGAVVGWGNNDQGQCNVPPLPSGLTYVAIDAGVAHSAALRSDGAVLCWGSNGFGECNVPALPPGVWYVDVSAGGSREWHPPYYTIFRGFSLARRSDGELACWGDGSLGQCSPPPLAGAVYMQIDAGATHSLAIRGDGVAIGWRANGFGQSHAPSPPASSAYVSIAAGDGFSVARFETSAPLVYCTAGTTTNGCSASIAASANPSVSLAYACDITVSNVEGQKSGILLYGLASNSVPWSPGSNSFLCVKAPMQRTDTQSSGGTLNSCDGALPLDWNAYQAANPTALGNPWASGNKAYVQAWFRDPPAPSSTNLSNALELTYLP